MIIHPGVFVITIEFALLLLIIMYSKNNSTDGFELLRGIQLFLDSRKNFSAYCNVIRVYFRV